jgi:hypothetical protein
MSERVMSGKLAILLSEVEPLTQVCGIHFHALCFVFQSHRKLYYKPCHKQCVIGFHV